VENDFPSLDELISQESNLRISAADVDPIALGNFLREEIEQAKLPLCLIVRMYGRTIFQIAAPGSQSINDSWMLRKARVAELFGHSSLYVRLEHQATGRPYESHGLDLNEYAFFGGGFPLKDEADRTYGAVAISGTLQLEEHIFLVDTLTRFKASLIAR